MARQFRSDDSSTWQDEYGVGTAGALTISSDIADSARSGYANTTFSGVQTTSSGITADATGFAANDLVIIYQSRNGGDGAAVWEFNRIVSVGSGTDWTLFYPLENDYGTTGQVYRLAQNIITTIDSGKTLTGVAWDGSKGGIVALMAQTSITVTGGITNSGKGYRGGTPSVSGDTNAGHKGEGTIGGDATGATANGNGGGGASTGTGRATGGGGGNGATGTAGSTNGSKTPGSGGAAAGNAELTVMVFGGGGGAPSAQGGENGGIGGAGGGIIILMAPTITVTGTITNSGGNGAVAGHAGGAGGAGGSILFKGANIVLGSNLVTASAGSGGAADTTGPAGSVGRIHVDYATSLSGTTTPTLDSRQDASLLQDATTTSTSSSTTSSSTSTTSSTTTSTSTSTTSTSTSTTSTSSSTSTTSTSSSTTSTSTTSTSSTTTMPISFIVDQGI